MATLFIQLSHLRSNQSKTMAYNQLNVLFRYTQLESTSEAIEKRVKYNELHLESINAGQNRDRSWDIVFADERHDCNHGETAVVEFSRSLDFEGGLVDARKIDLGKDHLWEASTHHVVWLLGFSGDFGNEDSGDDLCLTCKKSRKRTDR